MRPLLSAIFLVLTALTVTAVHAQEVTAKGANTGQAGPVAWRSLSAEQRVTLAPLNRLWPSLNSEHQLKWLALTQHYSRMTPDERATLQGRMTAWASLTPAQRTQARLNFGEVRKVPADERRAKWEEYQALPPEERQRLANDRPQPPRGAAPALRPAPVGRLLRPARTPTPTTSNEVRPAAPVNRNTLLPQPPRPVVSAPR